MTAPLKPVLFLAFADPEQPSTYRRSLTTLRTERQEIEAALRAIGAFEVVVQENATLDDVVSVFLRHRDRVALFHYGGHAESEGVLLHEASVAGRRGPGGGDGALAGTDLAGFLAGQRGLRFVFLNACSTGRFADALVEAGVPAVAGTSVDVEDDVAAGFAATFYRSLASRSGEVSLAEAFADAENVTKAQLVDAARKRAGGEWGAMPENERRVRVAYRSETLASEREPAYRQEWPWALRTDGEKGGEWSLSEAVVDPLFGLPALPDDIGLPETPFRYLDRFQRGDARLFFGRGGDIRDVYRLLTGEPEPVLLLYGQSGVGKSSFLEAGLGPRMESEGTVRHLRRDPELGLLGTLASGLECDPEGAAVARAWRAVEADEGRPLLMVLDQVEEAYTQPVGRPGAEMAALAGALRALFGAGGDPPRGRLVLAFRKEWLAEIRAQLKAVEIPCGEKFLRPLDREGIVAAVRGLAVDPGLRDRFGLEIEERLPEVVADDLLGDSGSALAPTLQVLLTKMWETANRDDAGRVTFDLGGYQQLKKRGALLSDFLDAQLTELERRLPEAAQSGLALDVLAFHVTALGTARKRTRLELAGEYHHVSDTLAGVIEELHALHLLTLAASRSNPEGSVHSRLAHDTLAPLIRLRVDRSRRPGQLLRRCLEFRGGDWRSDGNGDPAASLLDERDLALVEPGRRGMRALTDEEARLIEASRARLTEQDDQRRALESMDLAARGRRHQEADRLVGAAALAFGALCRQGTDQAMLLAHDVVGRSSEWLSMLDVTGGTTRVRFAPGGDWIVTTGREGHAALWSASTGERVADLVGHRGEVLEVAFPADGASVATAGEDGSVRSWSVPGGTRLQAMGGADSGSRAVALSRDGTTAATVGEDPSTVTLWSVATGQPLRELKMRGGRGVFGLALSPDGSTVLTLTVAGLLRGWDVASGAPLAWKRKGVALDWFAEFSPDGSRFAMPHPRGVEVRGETTQVLEDPDGPATAVAFDPAGGRLIVATRGKRVVLWAADAHGGFEKQATLRHPEAVTTVAFAPEGRRVLTGARDGARLWSLESFEVEARFRSGYGGGPAASFNSDGRRVATAGWPTAIWRVEPARGAVTLGRGDLTDHRWRPCPQCVPTRTAPLPKPGVVRVWSTFDGSLVGTVDDPRGDVHGAHCDGERGRMLTWNEHGSEVRLWDLESRSAASVLGGVPGGGVSFGLLGPDGRLALAAPRDVAVPFHLFDLESGAAAGQVPRGVGEPEFDPGGRRLLTWRGPEVTIHFLERDESSRILRGSDTDVVRARFSPDGRWVLTVSEREKARLWSAESGELVREFEYAGGVREAVFDAAGRLLATAPVRADEVTRIWSIDEKAQVSELGREKEKALQPSFSPDGGSLLTHDGRLVRIWSVETGACVAVVPPEERDFWYASFTPDGERVVTAFRGGEARISPILRADDLRGLLRRRIPAGIRPDFIPDVLLPEERRELLDRQRRVPDAPAGGLPSRPGPR